jgi:hypothetical protein
MAMATADEPIDPNRQECPNRCDLGDRFYIKEPIAWVTCIITRPRDKLEHREKFTLDRGVYQPVFSGLTERGFRVELCADIDNGREWGVFYNCCGGRTLLDVSVDASDEQLNEIAAEMENEPSFYNPSRLFHFMDGRRFVVSLAEDDLSIPTYRPEE